MAEKTLSSCSSALERGYSFADSAYGTDEQLLGETTSVTDYYSDPFSSAITPVKDVESSPSKESEDKAPKRKYSCLSLLLFKARFPLREFVRAKTKK